MGRSRTVRIRAIPAIIAIIAHLLAATITGIAQIQHTLALVIKKIWKIRQFNR
jgi:hypothetical protein